MTTTTKPPTYQSLVAEYEKLTHAHDASILAAAQSRKSFITADRDEIKALKRTLTSNTTLIRRSDIYRTHLKYCKSLSRHLLTWNAELRAHADTDSLDDVELLRYGTACFHFMTATSRLAVMNQRGMRAKDRCEERYDKVDRIRERKRKASKAGMEAYARQNAEHKRMLAFLKKLETFAQNVEDQVIKAGGEPDLEFRLKMDRWLDDVEDRLNAELEKAEADREWDRVCKSDVIKEGVDANAAAEEEELLKNFDEMMETLGKHSWCPCCGAGGPPTKKKESGKDSKKEPRKEQKESKR